MTSEPTEIIRGWVFYDADCAFCRGWAERTHDLLLRRGYHLAPLQAKWAQMRLNPTDGGPSVAENVSFQPSPRSKQNSDEAAIGTGAPIGSINVPPLSLSPGERAGVRASITQNVFLSQMKLLTANGTILGGADALIHLTRAIWWALPIFIFTQIPGVKPVMRTVYRSIARNRHCSGNHLRLPGQSAKHQHHPTSSFYELP